MASYEDWKTGKALDNRILIVAIRTRRAAAESRAASIDHEYHYVPKIGGVCGRCGIPYGWH